MAALSLEVLLGQPSEELVDQLYKRIDAGEARKATHAHRLAELDRVIAQVVVEHLPAGRPIRVHDAAASNAITSLELYDCLRPLRPVILHASDYYDCITMARMGSWRVFFDVDGAPLQFAWHGIGIDRHSRRVKWLLPILKRLILPKAIAVDPSQRVRISLIHPKALARAAEDANFTIGRDDIFAPGPKTYDVVRLMNTVMKVNFSEQRALQALRSMLPTVAEGGLFVIGRNMTFEDRDRCNASIYQRQQDGQFTPVMHINSGYEWGDLIPLAMVG